tara:strand:- start:111 stop:1211 length:1101 start_codon:yes stop_codon:yes gene_type:complete
MYDYLIVGSGLFGSVFARLATDAGKKCLIIEKRNYIAGNCSTENIEGINVQKFGGHIFHTNNKEVWNFAQRFTEFNNFINSPKALSGGKLYSLPFNMNTFYELWGSITPEEAKIIIEKQKFKGNPTNLEEQALSLVGKDIYEKLIKGYTEKQWGRSPINLPSFIIKRLPLRFIYDNNYYKERYQGWPKGGYTKMFEKILNGIEVKLNTDYFTNKEYFNSLATKVVYTGCIDEFFNYEFGDLEYRSLKFDHKILNTSNFQGNATLNYCDTSVDYTRCLEHKHFEKINSEKTVISYEYPVEYKRGMIPFYPINDDRNQKIYKKYKDKSSKLTNFIFGGRLSEYKYLDMHIVIEFAINKFKKEMKMEEN